jgi:hypothetical protein
MKNRTNLFQNIPLKNLSWKQAKVRFPGINPYADYDGDRIQNRFDFRPFDSSRQKVPNRRESVANEFSVRELRQAVKSHRTVKAIMGKRNPVYVNGEGEKYQRIRINNEKIKMAHIAWRLKYGRKIPEGYNIHHKDENKRNDRPSNLKLVKAVPHGNENLRRGR